ncbi:YppG family protein [Salipaludibacillus sp. CUR1]|uniref:YppG family protein n=1 Tax=Salipaludibacillus sp. CUR1 TaxID=2820003 RepID=UPI001E471F36|nr:YppG family protein [Salipaludibacillus sp. CUR1]MCE7794780.1 YppG family protein [Salipaludibacillus sp. CUR1]
MFFGRPPRQPNMPHEYHQPFHPPGPPSNQWPGYGQSYYQQQHPSAGYPPYQQFGGYPPAPQQNPGSKLMQAFQTSDGKFDFQKAMTTMDQVVKTANQVSPLVKQVGSFFTKAK